MFALVLAVAGCGRFGFDAGGAGDARSGDGGGGTSDGATTGPTGARYGLVLDGNAKPALVAGRDGKVAVAESFVSATTIAGVALAGHAQFESYGLVWLDPGGVPGASSVFDSNDICELRDLGASATGVVATGYSQSGATTPAYGACSLTTAHQDGVAIGVDMAGAQHLDMHAISTSINVQGWTATTFDDDAIGIAGVYGSIGKIGTQSLPATSSDENAYYTRVDPATGEPSWLFGVTSPGLTYANGLDALGGDACVMGSFSGAVTVLGASMTSSGANDVWIARLDPSGHARWIAQLGGLGDDGGSTGTVVATADGGCTAAFPSTGDLIIGGATLPVSAGPAALLHFDGSGAYAGGARTSAWYQLAQVGGRVFGTVTCAAPCMIGSIAYTPATSDVIVMSLDDVTAPVILATARGGATLEWLAAVPPDAIAFTCAITAPVAFGLDVLIPTGATSTAVAVVGVGD
jgi:hypothetical protein